MGAIDPTSFSRRSRRLDLDGIDFDAVADTPVPAEVLRTLRYMQDIESHTIIYVRTLLHTRAIDDPEVANFLACWFYEETAHGLALARFLEAAGSYAAQRARSHTPIAERVEQIATGWVARMWPDFVAVHMTWGAINELTTFQGYKRLAQKANHPILSELIARILRDESRHFDFYFHQADRYLRRPGAARVARFLVDRFWGPVGTGVQPDDEVHFLARYLLTGPDGLAAVRRIDSTIAKLPGFEDVRLIERWLRSQPDLRDQVAPVSLTARGTGRSGGAPARTARSARP